MEQEVGTWLEPVLTSCRSHMDIFTNLTDKCRAHNAKMNVRQGPNEWKLCFVSHSCDSLQHKTQGSNKFGTLFLRFHGQGPDLGEDWDIMDFNM